MMNNTLLAKRIREEQEMIYRPYNVDIPEDSEKVLPDEDGVKHYPFNSKLAQAQGLNSYKSNKPIRKKNQPSVNQSCLSLLSDNQLQWFNSPNFHNKCSYYVDDDRSNASSLFDFFVTITPPYENRSTEQDLLNLTKICLRKSQSHINPKNRHRINDATTLPNVQINVCKECNTYVHLHIVLKAMSVRDFKVLIYFLFNIYRAKFPRADVEYHNSICNETTEHYTSKQIIRTLFTKDVFNTPPPA